MAPGTGGALAQGSPPGATESELREYHALFERRLVESHFAQRQDYADHELEFVAVRDTGKRAEVASVMRSNGGRIEGLLATLRATAAAD